jgi:CheY-like chemotaxis protein
MLESLGCDVDVASNGREAVLGAASDTYDLILMDCQMPEMDGEQAAAIIRLIRESEQDRKAGNGSHVSHVPIVALTAHSSIDSRQRCLDAGMDDFLGKPFEREELASLVDHWLTRKTRDGSAETE